MATITLKDIPMNLHKALKQRAKRSGRSLNKEVLTIISDVLGTKKIDVENFLADVKEIRDKIPGRLTDEIIEQGRSIGRP